MPTNKDAAIRKRQKIQDSNKSMFIWIVSMSAVVGLCLVVSWFLFKQIQFRSNVIGAKNETVRVLEHNNKIANELIGNIRKNETNTNLNQSKANPDDKALQVILDALPAEPNSLALGSSLQKKLAAGIPGVSIESLAVTPVSEADLTATEPQEIEFQLTASSNDVNQLRELLYRLERSVRTIDVTNMVLDRATDNYTISINGVGYYLPARSLELTEEKV